MLGTWGAGIECFSYCQAPEGIPSKKTSLTYGYAPAEHLFRIRLIDTRLIWPGTLFSDRKVTQQVCAYVHTKKYRFAYASVRHFDLRVKKKMTQLVLTKAITDCGERA